MRIDAHVHFTPPELSRNLAAFAQQEPYWGMLLKPPSLQGWVTAEGMIEAMDQAGLDKVILQGEYFQQHASCVARNSQALDIINRWPNRVIAFAVVQPKAGQAALDELKRCLENGMHGVGELNPYAQNFRLDDLDFLRVVEMCLAYNVPLNLHANETVGPYYAGKGTMPLHHYYALARNYPELKLILAHWGGGLIFYELLPGVQQNLRNVWYDTAASPLLFPTPKIFTVALQCVDPGKILYGSDYPLRIYPKQQIEPDFQHFISEIEALKLEPAIYENIMGHNAARLLGLMDMQPAPSQLPQTAPPSAAVDGQIYGFMAVAMVARAWPETEAVFEKFGIPWQDSSVPKWEPITQAAAAKGWDVQRLLAALNEALQN